jgi:hypothetical protein
MNRLEAEQHVKLDSYQKELFRIYYRNPTVLTTAIIGNNHIDSYPEVKVDVSFNNGDHLQVISSYQNTYMLPWTLIAELLSGSGLRDNLMEYWVRYNAVVR